MSTILNNPTLLMLSIIAVSALAFGLGYEFCSYFKGRQKLTIVEIDFPDLCDCMIELNLWKSNRIDTPESYAARRMHELIKSKIDIGKIKKQCQSQIIKR